MRYGFFALLLTLCFASAQNLPNSSDLGIPAGQVKVFEFQTLPTSVQIYTCKASPTGAFSWVGPDPDAILVSQDKSLTVHHYKGPTWEATDGSIVLGSNAKHFRAARENSVDWLELTAKGGTQKFAKVALIHRVETEGGVAPDPVMHSCDATHVGDQVRVPYSARYEFFAAK
jgi:hypothetical protein